MKSKVICVIMGGGRGTRLHPLTKDRSKPAVPLAGKYRLVDIPISNCLNSGFNKIYVLTQFQTASLHRHIQESYKFDPFGGGFVDILAAEQTDRGQTWYQGTADAVRQNLHHFRAEDEDLFLVLSGDQLYRLDFRDIIDQHRRSGAEITIAAKAIPTHEVEGLGIMRVNDDLSVAEFVEKPKDPKIIESLAISPALLPLVEDPQPQAKYCLASMGIYVFNKRLLFEALADPDQTDFGKEVIPSFLGRRKLSAFVFNGYWEDIGTVRSFFECNLSLTDTVPPFNFFERHRPIFTHARYLPASKINDSHLNQAIVADGCIISRARLQRCVMGVRAFIRDGSSLTNVVMMGQDYFETPEDFALNKQLGRPDIGVGCDCVIEQAIIDKNARIGDRVRLSPDGKPDLWEKDGVVVRDGVLIVSKGAIIPNDTVI